MVEQAGIGDIFQMPASASPLFRRLLGYAPNELLHVLLVVLDVQVVPSKSKTAARVFGGAGTGDVCRAQQKERGGLLFGSMMKESCCFF